MEGRLENPPPTRGEIGDQARPPGGGARTAQSLERSRRPQLRKQCARSGGSRRGRRPRNLTCCAGCAWRDHRWRGAPRAAPVPPPCAPRLVRRFGASALCPLGRVGRLRPCGHHPRRSPAHRVALEHAPPAPATPPWLSAARDPHCGRGSLGLGCDGALTRVACRGPV